MRATATGVVLACALLAQPAAAQISDMVVKIGVLTDMSGAFSDQTGRGSVLGAELAANGGIKDFLTSHRDELKGAIFIDIEALGAGTLTSIGHEGTYFPVKPSSRMGRYVRKASAALGMHVAEGSMLWRDSAAAVALRQGCQAMHFAGMEGDKPAHAASKDDVMANVSEDVMLANADFIVEVLKSI